jgi:two-component system nitrate/nitrite response regulator NarL
MAASRRRDSFGFMWERSEELSRREREVLDQIRLGLTNRQIAARLGVSTNTINKHVQEVLRKLEVDNRVQAALHGLAVAV